jgi:hypothetical protein
VIDAKPVAINVGVAAQMASDEGWHRDRVVDVAGVGLLGGESQGADNNRTVPLSLAGKGRASNIQNEVDPSEDGDRGRRAGIRSTSTSRTQADDVRLSHWSGGGEGC